MTATQAPLPDLLRALACQCGLSLELDGKLSKRRTLAFVDLPLRDAVHRLLHGHNFIARYPEPSSGNELAAAPLTGCRAAASGMLWVFGDDADFRGKPGAAPGAPAGSAVSRAAVDADAYSKRARRDGLEAITRHIDSGSEDDALALARLATRALDPALRLEAAQGLGELGLESGVDALAEVARSEHAGLRRAAIDALADIGGDTAAWALARLLEDARDPERRHPGGREAEHLIYALGDIGGNAAARSILEGLLGDPRPWVRSVTREVLDDNESSKHEESY